MSKYDCNQSEEDEDIHYISDDDINETEKIIREKCKVFPKEKEAARLFLSDHFRKFRYDFFLKVKKTHKSIYQAIKREIRNCLNPYRIFIKEKEFENKKELDALCVELKSYYKEKHFNNTFFINYFNDLKKAHKNMNKSKFINMLPKSEEEALNDIERKVMIIKALKHYLTGNIINRFQNISLEYNKPSGNKDIFKMMYQYLVIIPAEFSSLDEEELNTYLSNQKGSMKLRRPISDNDEYNYVPILCKGQCKLEADLFIQNFEKEYYQNHTDCKECEFLNNNIDSLKSQIRSLYTKTCIFSHNINEIMFHPLFFFSLENIPFYISELKNQQKKPGIENISSIVITEKIPEGLFDKNNNYKLNKLYKGNMTEIMKLLKEYSIKTNLFGGSCFLPDYKTKKCPLDLLKPNQEDWNYHLIKCPCYHSDLEKRRVIKINKNQICPNVLDGDKWKENPNDIKCENGEKCDKYHTRNEVFYDERNFRKLYPCMEYNKKEEGEFLCNFCTKFDMCPKKHPIDFKIDELFLTSECKTDLQRELKGLKEKNNLLRKRMEKINKIECKCCLKYIDGEEERHLIYFNNCSHIICLKCYEICKLCPLCGLKSDQDHILIKIEIGEKNEEKSENNIINLENDEEDNNNNINNTLGEGVDDDLQDSDSEGMNKVNDSGIYGVSINNTTESKENASLNNKNESEGEGEQGENSENNSFSSFSNSMRGGGNNRGRRRGRGRGGREAYRGRGRGEMRGIRYRGRGRGRH